MGPCQASKQQKYVQPSMTNDPHSGQLNTVGKRGGMKRRKHRGVGVGGNKALAFTCIVPSQRT